MIPTSRWGRTGPRIITDPARVRPRWKLLGVTMVGFAALPLAAASPRTALYWYVWPLFGLGVAYVIQFRDEFPRRWKIAGISMVPLSIVALALDWPFSGHIMWNVVFIGHAWMTGKRHTTWMRLMGSSLIYLFVLKAFSQTGRDLIGGFISVAVGAGILAILGPPQQEDDSAPRRSVISSR